MSGLIIDPDAELKFTLSKSEATPRCVLTLKHPGTTDDHMAFKVSKGISKFFDVRHRRDCTSRLRIASLRFVFSGLSR